MIGKTLRGSVLNNCNRLLFNYDKLNTTPLLLAVNHQTTVSNIEQLKSIDDMPGPKSYPFIGSLLSFKGFGGDLNVTNMKELAFQLQERYGDLVKFNILGFQQVYVFKPDHIRKVFAIDGEMPVRHGLDPLMKYFDLKGYPQTLVNSQNQRWRKLRSASNPITGRPQSVHLFMKQHDQIASEFIKYLNKKFENGANIVELDNLDLKLKLLALELISVVAFDNRIHCVDENNKDALDATPLVKAVDDFFTYSGYLAFGPPFWKVFPTTEWKKFVEACDILFGTARKYVSDALEEIKKLSDEEKANMNSRTILQQYLLTKDKYGVTVDDIIALTSDFIFAGIDTTAATMHFAIYELARNQEVQNDLYEEINRVVGKSENVTDEMLAKMPMLKAVVKETLRMHSVVPANSRSLQEDLVLDNYKIPKGTFIAMGVMYITRSERFFRNSNTFIPKRWIKGQKEHDPIDPYANLPFGFGARQCAGRRIAEQELYLSLIKIFQNYKIEYTGETLGHRVRLIAAPDKPLNVRLIKRN